MDTFWVFVHMTAFCQDTHTHHGVGVKNGALIYFKYEGTHERRTIKTIRGLWRNRKQWKWRRRNTSTCLLPHNNRLISCWQQYFVLSSPFCYIVSKFRRILYCSDGPLEIASYCGMWHRAVLHKRTTLCDLICYNNVSQIFLLVDHLWLGKRKTDSHILAHVNREYPVIGIQNYKFISQNWF